MCVFVATAECRPSLPRVWQTNVGDEQLNILVQIIQGLQTPDVQDESSASQNASTSSLQAGRRLDSIAQGSFDWYVGNLSHVIHSGVIDVAQPELIQDLHGNGMMNDLHVNRLTQDLHCNGLIHALCIL